MTFNKGQYIVLNGEDQLKCVVADSEYACFARVSRRYDATGDSFINTDFEKMIALDNTGTVDLDYHEVKCENLIQQ